MGKVKAQKLSLEELLEQALVKEEDRPYEVPENWVWCSLGTTTKLRRGASPRPISNYVTEDKDGVNWIKIGDTDDRKYLYSTNQKITAEGAKKSVYLESGSLILSNSMSFGRPYILECNGCIHDGWLAITFYNKFIIKEYMYYVLLASRWYFEQVAVGTAVRNLNIERVSALPFPIPPFEEQQRIVTIIEEFFEKLDASKELAQNALDSFENRKAAILHKAFKGELTTKWREENEVDLDEWRETNLKSICKISSGGTPSRTNDDFYTGEIPWVKTGEIKWNYISDSEEKITEDAIKNSSARLFPIGTVLVAMYGQGLTRGRAAILKIEAATNQAVCALMPNSLILNKYLYYYFMCNYWILREKAVGGNQPNFSGTIIGGFIINLPSVKEQKKIIAILDDLLENEQQAKDLCDVIEKIDLMKKAILARAFRGELGTNNPDEESAIELLKEVLKEKL